MKTSMNIYGKNYQVEGIMISGHAGNYTVTGIINGDLYSAKTNNASLMDDFNESEDYYQDDNSGHWYDSAEEVDRKLAEILIIANEL